MLCAGLMSGTSLDGVDAALVRIEGQGEDIEARLLSFDTLPMPEKLKARVKQACDPTQSNVQLICELNFELGDLFARALEKVCTNAGIRPQSLDFAASHGQTIWHISHKQPGIPSTLQIGEPAVMAYRYNIPVVSNFRVMDIAAGGDGAPLVPFAEYILYSDSEKNIGLQNIGGIGNITYLKKGGTIDEVLAFDTGPGNMMIDEAMTSLFGVPYDQNGQTARQGNLCAALFEELKAHSYFDRQPPKSTGREEFGQRYTQSLLEKYAEENPEDIIYTFTEFTAWSIVRSIRDHIMPIGPLNQLVVSGGGANNPYLMERIQMLLPETEVCTQNSLGYSNDAKEAIAFAVLGYETLHGAFSNVPKATGAKKKIVLGVITPRPVPQKENIYVSI